MTSDPIAVHCAALAPLGHDCLHTSQPALADWIERHAPGCFVRLLVLETYQPHVLVPAARWAACGADVMQIEEER